MYRWRSHGHLAGVFGCAGASHVYAIPGGCPNVGGGAGSISEFRGRIVFRHLSGVARVTARSDCGFEVRLMAIMTPAQVRENFLAALEDRKSTRLNSSHS